MLTRCLPLIFLLSIAQPAAPRAKISAIVPAAVMVGGTLTVTITVPPNYDKYVFLRFYRLGTQPMVVQYKSPGILNGGASDGAPSPALIKHNVKTDATWLSATSLSAPNDRRQSYAVVLVEADTADLEVSPAFTETAEKLTVVAGPAFADAARVLRHDLASINTANVFLRRMSTDARFGADIKNDLARWDKAASGNVFLEQAPLAVGAEAVSEATGPTFLQDFVSTQKVVLLRGTQDVEKAMIMVDDPQVRMNLMTLLENTRKGVETLNAKPVSTAK